MSDGGAASSADGAQPDAARPSQPGHTRCGWIDDPGGEQSFVAHAAEFDWVHPRWYTMASDGVNILPANRPDLQSVVDAARASNVRIAPLIDSLDTGYVRTMINDASLRSRHVQALVNLVQSHGYAGIDIDYEHLWSAADRPGYEAFMTELSGALHAVGAELSMAAPGFEDDPRDSAYYYPTLVQVCDTLHVMGYDYHYSGGDHMGPMAPLGWIDAVFAHAQATGHPEKFMIGVGNYGIGPGGWWSMSSRAAQADCVATPITTTDHMSSCPYGHEAAGRAPHCLTANDGEIWYEDVASMEEKIIAAQSHGARGVTYWTIGDEMDGYFAMVRRHYP